MNLEQQIDRAGLNSNVYLLGRKGKKRLALYYVIVMFLSCRRDLKLLVLFM